MCFTVDNVLIEVIKHTPHELVTNVFGIKVQSYGLMWQQTGQKLLKVVYLEYVELYPELLEYGCWPKWATEKMRNCLK